MTQAQEFKLRQIRSRRSLKLAEVDVKANKAAFEDLVNKDQWAAYRTALLDITEPYKENPSLLDSLQVNNSLFPAKPSDTLSAEIASELAASKAEQDARMAVIANADLAVSQDELKAVIVAMAKEIEVGYAQAHPSRLLEAGEGPMTLWGRIKAVFGA